MLLIIDVGNSNTVVAACEPTDDSTAPIWRLTSRRESTADDWRTSLVPLLHRARIKPGLVDDVVISSVVPKITRELTLQSEGWLRTTPLIVSADLKLGITVAIQNPLSVGADRICNAVAGYELIQGAVIVVDVGTATKVEAIDCSGVYLGGAIAPGIGISLDALVSRAAQLYTVELKVPDQAIGVNTVHAVQSGLLLGHLSMIEGMVARFKQVLGNDTVVILTGGYGSLLWQKSPVFQHHEPDLTLRGALSIWQLNRATTAARAR